MFFLIKKKPRGFQKKPLMINISSKVAKKATVRNLIKRRIKAILQPIVKKSNWDYLIIVQPPVVNLSFAEMKEELLKLIQKDDFRNF